MKKLIQLICMSMVAAGLAFGADVSGKWKGTFLDAPGLPVQTYVLQSEGSKLTGVAGTLAGEIPISDGKLDGDTITFVVIMKMGDEVVNVTHTGRITDGELMLLDVAFGNNKPNRMTLKREK